MRPPSPSRPSRACGTHLHSTEDSLEEVVLAGLVQPRAWERPWASGPAESQVCGPSSWEAGGNEVDLGGRRLGANPVCEGSGPPDYPPGPGRPWNPAGVLWVGTPPSPLPVTLSTAITGAGVPWGQCAKPGPSSRTEPVSVPPTPGTSGPPRGASAGPALPASPLHPPQHPQPLPCTHPSTPSLSPAPAQHPQPLPCTRRSGPLGRGSASRVAPAWPAFHPLMPVLGPGPPRAQPQSTLPGGRGRCTPCRWGSALRGLWRGQRGVSVP